MKYDIAIATTTYFAPYCGCKDGDYRLRLFLDEVDSVRRVDWAGRRAVWVIYDDASPSFPEIDAGIPIEVTRRTENVTWARNLPEACARACELGEWVINLDSDGLLSRDCIVRAMQMVDKFPDAVAYGLFNTKYHHTKQQIDRYDIKQSQVEHGMMFRSKTWRDAVESYPDPFIRFAWLRTAEGSFYPTLKPSGVQHTGKFGLNSTEDDFDPDWRD